MMDDSTIEATQALDFGDYEDEIDDDLDREQEPVGFLKVPFQKGFPEKLYPVYQGDNVIGRHDSCKISIPMKGLSREHACIEVKGDAHFIYDKGSRNRTQRNTHFLTASVRYELKDNDRLTFGDVDCSYQVGGQVQGADGDDTGSETGSESMFQTAGPGGEDCHSDGSSDILEPTQPFVANTQSMIKMGRKTNDASASLGITVEDTPAASRTKRFTDSLLIPDSDLEDDEASSPLTIQAADSRGKREDVRSKLMAAPTQDYVSDSDATTDDEEDKRTKSILTAATQAFTEDDISTCSEDSPRKHSILTAATQAFVGDSDADSPIKKDAKKNLQLEPTQGYDMEKGIEPTMAYDMDDDDGDTDEVDKEEVCSVSKGGSMMFEPTQAYTDNTEVSGLDDKEEETSVKKGGSMMFEPTQAYEDNAEMAADKSKEGDDQSDTSEEFVLDGDTDNEGGEGSDGEVMSGLMAAPTLAMDMGDNTQEFDHEDATNIADDNATVGVDDHDQTVPVAESGKEDPKPYSGKGNKGKQLDKATKDFEIATVNIDETVAVQADATVAVDATIAVNESDATMAIDKIDATVEVKEVDATVEINQAEATVAINEDNATVAIKEVDATVAINEVDATVAVKETDATMAINEVGSSVAVMEPDAAVAIKEVDATVALMEPDATVAINEVDATVAVMEADATMTINEVDATVAVMEPDATVAINEVDASVAVMEADATMAVDESDATVEITDIVTEETAFKSKTTSASDNEDSTRVFGMDEHEQCTDDVSVIAKQDDEAVEMEPTQVFDVDETETVPVTSVAVKKGGRGRSKGKAVVNEKQEQSVSENSKTNTRSKGRNKTKTETVKEAATVKPQTNRGRRSRKEKNEPIEDNEPATQVYEDNSEEAGPSDEPATQMYVDEDATPSLSELCEDVPAVESMLSRSPLKSALASPKKKTPSPKRVQFMSQRSETGSEASETSGGRPRQGRKLDESDRKMDKDEKKKGKGSGRQLTAVSQEKEDGVTDAISSESKPNRVTRGKVTNATDSKQPALKSRRSVGSEVAASEEIVNSRGRSSLPTVLDKKSSRSNRRDKTAQIEESIAVKNDEFGSHTEVIKNEKVSKRGRKEIKKEENEMVPVGETAANTAQSDEPVKSRAKRKGREEIVDENDKKEVIIETIPTESVDDKRKGRGIVKSKASKVGNTTEKDMQSNVSTKRGGRNSKTTTQCYSDKQTEDIVENNSSLDEKGINSKMQSGRQTRGKKVTCETTNIDSDKAKSETNEPVTRVINIESEELKTNVSNKIPVDKPDNSESVPKGKSRTTKRNIKVEHTESETKRTRAKAGGDANVNSDVNTKTDLNEATKRTTGKGGKSIREKTKQTNEKVSETIGQPEVKLDSDDSVSKKSIRGKRKESASSSMDSSQTVDGQTPAKKLKTRNSQETVVVTPHSSNKRTSLPATETPKTNAKKLSSMSTPKGSSTKELDTSLVNSPTLRKTTTEGIKARVMFTGVVDDQGEKIVKELGGELVSSVYDCTHLVTDQIRRTVKFLCCLSRGVPIVSPQWLVSSKRSGFFSDPSSFLVSDDASEKKFKLSLRRSLDKANERPLFSGYKIHVTKSVKPDPAHMKDIVQCAGAQYVESMPRKASPNMVVISCKEDQSQCGLAMKAGIPVVNAEFVLTGILRQEVDVNAFSLSSGDTGRQGQQSSEPPSKKRKR